MAASSPSTTPWNIIETADKYDVTLRPKESEAETQSRLSIEAKELDHKHTVELDEIRHLRVLDYVVLAFLGAVCIACGIFIFRFHSKSGSARGMGGAGNDLVGCLRLRGWTEAKIVPAVRLTFVALHLSTSAERVWLKTLSEITPRLRGRISRIDTHAICDVHWQPCAYSLPPKPTHSGIEFSQCSSSSFDAATGSRP